MCSTKTELSTLLDENIKTMRVKLKVRGKYAKTENALRALQRRLYLNDLHNLGPQGVDALRKATPKDTGKTAESWFYKVVDNGKYISIHWANSNRTKDNVSIAFLIEYGHATKNGGYVPPRPYISGAIDPVVDKVINSVWRAVVKTYEQ